MGIVTKVIEPLHRIKVRMQSSNLPGGGGKKTYARIVSEAVLDVDKICAALVNRGGFSGNHAEAVVNVKRFLGEMMYQLCDGYEVSTEFFSIRPSVGGFFDNTEDPDWKNHPVRFRFRALPRLRELAKFISVTVVQNAPDGSIGRLVDGDSGEVNGTVSSGGLVTVTGAKLKISGSDPACGLYFVSSSKPPARIKADGSYPVNTSRKVIARVPALPSGEYSVEIKTQYTIGGIPLKEPRTIKSGFTVRKT